MSIAIIGGSGFYEFPELSQLTKHTVATDYGEVRDISQGFVGEKAVFFIPRHGAGHAVAPHKINYRANIAALQSLGVQKIIAFNAVGGITEDCPPAAIVLPDQVIDYTWGRAHTFYDDFADAPQHIDFTEPFDAALRQAMMEALATSEIAFTRKGTYACMQGPRLETAAEIRKLRQDACNIVGMTLMPEAALAREKGLSYAPISLVVNWAAGVEEGAGISLDAIMLLLSSEIPQIREVLLKTISLV